ncbi:MAG: hypothetical protein DWI45_01400 [Chloroflexi bacterium]|nr:MAG: hypothetical protein DWI45_01400 [Chloroflexota bacterium]
MSIDPGRRARALEGRGDVAARVDEVATARAAALDGARAIGDRLRPSGGLAKELRERPLRAIGLAALAGLAAIRWFGGRRGKVPAEGANAERHRGAATSFAAGIAAAAAERGGRAVVDALLSEHKPGAPLDGSAAAADDASGRVAKR